MKFFDLHCDTIGECFTGNKALLSNDLQLSLQRADCFEKYTQVFAIWIADELRGEAAYNYFDKCADYYRNELDINREYMKNHGITPILAVEGGAALSGELSNVQKLYDRGVKLITLTWNGTNEIASGCCEGGGLTDFGKEVITEMNRLGIIIDASHLNRRSFFELCEYTDRPFIASHSNLDTVDTPEGRRRNLSAEQAKEIIRRGGIIGVNFYNKFLQNKYESCFDAVYKRVYELCEIGGERAVCFGSDFDGCDIDSELCGIEKIPALKDYLQSRGFDELFLDRLFFGNASNYFEGF